MNIPNNLRPCLRDPTLRLLPIFLRPGKNNTDISLAVSFQAKRAGVDQTSTLFKPPPRFPPKNPKCSLVVAKNPILAQISKVSGEVCENYIKANNVHIKPPGFNQFEALGRPAAEAPSTSAASPLDQSCKCTPTQKLPGGLPPEKKVHQPKAQPERMLFSETCPFLWSHLRQSRPQALAAAPLRALDLGFRLVLLGLASRSTDFADAGVRGQGLPTCG